MILERFFSGTDNVDDQAGMGKHRHVATVDGIGGSTHTLRREAFQIRMDSAVVVGHDGPTRLRLPGRARGIPAEEVGSWRVVGGPNNLLLFLREISCEARYAFRTHPDAPVRDLNVFEDVGNGELLLLALRSFVGVGGKRSDIDEPGDAVIGSCGRDDTSTVGVADQNGWAADPP